MKNVGTLEFSLKSGEYEIKKTAEVMVYTPREAIKKAAMAFLFSLLMAFVAVFIPMVHFIAVPGFLFLGCVFAVVVFKAFNGQKSLVTGVVSCPNCQHPIDLPATLSVWPVRDQCQGCGANYSSFITQ